ncbi:MAG TPA: tetratricopeptide repeat protein, partial [Candidatus Saccharimonadales bacterium]|nr:tetratricopeptide repeat protein [Candidatus Saccharimonadales bacterium]
QLRAKIIFGTIALVSLTACLVITGRQLRYWRNSEALCRHAIAVTSDNYKAHFNLGEALIEKGKSDAGIQQLHEAVDIVPAFSGRKQLAEALARRGRIPEAITQYKELLRYDPNQLEALNNLAWWLATDANPKIRNGTEAVEFAQRACALTRYQKTVYVGTLGAAYAEAGQFDDAIKTAETAIALATAANETNLLEKNRQLLELYRTRRPYHEPAQ